MISTAVRGYHVYKDVWSPELGHKLECQHEPMNVHDSHAMGVYYNKKLVGHLPKDISTYFHFFTIHSGEVRGEVTGPRRYCKEAGGMEIPCKLTATGGKKMVERLKQLIVALNSSSITCT